MTVSAVPPKLLLSQSLLTSSIKDFCCNGHSRLSLLLSFQDATPKCYSHKFECCFSPTATLWKSVTYVTCLPQRFSHSNTRNFFCQHFFEKNLFINFLDVFTKNFNNAVKRNLCFDNGESPVCQINL